MISGIYKIQNKLDGKIYIGSAARLSKRLQEHRWYLNLGKHCNQKLQRAWMKYGEEAFEFSTLLICSKENLLDYEQRCIDGFDSVKSGYNICPTAGSPSGRIPSVDTREKIRAANTGKKVSDETKSRLSLLNKGKKHTESTKAKCAAANVGKKHSLETLKKMSEVQKGKVISEEQRKRLSELLVGRKLPASTRAKMSASRTGKPRSPEARANISAGRLKRFREQKEEAK